MSFLFALTRWDSNGSIIPPIREYAQVFLRKQNLPVAGFAYSPFYLKPSPVRVILFFIFYPFLFFIFGAGSSSYIASTKAVRNSRLSVSSTRSIGFAPS